MIIDMKIVFKEILNSFYTPLSFLELALKYKN